MTNGRGSGAALAVVGAEIIALAASVAYAPRMSRSQLALVLYGVGLALAWSFSLRGGFVYGFDITAEYQVARGTSLAGVWETYHPDDAYGAMLSLTVLPSTLEGIAGVSELVLLKAVYPALFALFPVVVFLIARRFLSSRYAFVAGAFIVVQSYFFQQLPGIARQEIGLLAFALLIAVALDRRIPRGPRLLLASLLGLTLAVSHYTTTYLAIATLAGAVVLQLAVSAFRPLPRANAALAVALVATTAGAAAWYGPVTHSSSNLANFAESVSERGLQPLPNREPGEGIVEAYLNGNTTKSVDAAEYQELARLDYEKNRGFVVPLESAAEPRYDLRDSRAPPGDVESARAASALDGAELALQQVTNALAIVGALVLSLRRRTRPALRTVALLGLSTLVVLATIRLSGTAANAYNQERAYLQALVPLVVGLAWLAQAGARRLRRLGWAATAAVGLALAVLLANTSGLVRATVGSGAATNLADRGEDHERFVIGAPELASAAWVRAAKPGDALLYADRYGQLRLAARARPATSSSTSRRRRSTATPGSTPAPRTSCTAAARAMNSRRVGVVRLPRAVPRRPLRPRLRQRRLTGLPPMISIVVISKDEAALDGTLAELAAHAEGLAEETEVVVVDASRGRLDPISAIPSEGALDRLRAPARRGHHRFLTSATRRGAARGEIIVFTDAGCRPREGWLRRLVAPLLAGEEPSRPASRPRRTALACTTGAPPRPPLRHLHECPTINMAFRREAFDAVGGFDEALSTGPTSTSSWRLVDAGQRIRSVADAVVAHDWGSQGRQLRRGYRYGRARARLYRKHPRRLPAAARQDPMVFAYPLFLLGLPLALRYRSYLTLLLVPAWRNRARRAAARDRRPPRLRAGRAARRWGAREDAGRSRATPTRTRSSSMRRSGALGCACATSASSPAPAP